MLTERKKVLRRMEEPARMSFKERLAAPKGHLDYQPDQAVLLHVFWEAPSMEAALTLLRGLQQCAEATKRDTPCTVTYIFRIVQIDNDLASPPPSTLQDIPAYVGAHRNLKFGTPRPVVEQEIRKRGLDVSALDLLVTSADASVPIPLPPSLQNKIQPVYLEFTEAYLDERAFMEHAASRQYLDGYAVVMNPAAFYRTPVTYRLGTPTQNLIDTILEPVLKDTPLSMIPNGHLFNQVPTSKEVSLGVHLFISLDVAGTNANEVASQFTKEFVTRCSLFVAFEHPLRSEESVVRVMCVVGLSCWSEWFPAFQTSADGVTIHRGEICGHPSNDNGIEDTTFSALCDAMRNVVGQLFITDAAHVAGYARHPKANLVHVSS